MKSDCATWVQFPFCVDVGGMGKLGRIKSAEVEILSASPDFCHPTPPVWANAKDAGMLVMRGGGSSVLLIDVLRNIAQVCKSVVGAIPVDVVNLVFRPFAVNVQVCQPVRQKRLLVDADDFRAAGLRSGANNIASLPSPDIGEPGEYTSFRVVVKKFAQTLRGKIGLSHDALLMLIGQRPASADNASGLRYFSGGM